LLALEDRLPLGETLLGALFGTWLVPGLAVLEGP
jgi:hypothetical protein